MVIFRVIYKTADSIEYTDITVPKYCDSKKFTNKRWSAAVCEALKRLDELHTELLGIIKISD